MVKKFNSFANKRTWWCSNCGECYLSIEKQPRCWKCQGKVKKQDETTNQVLQEQ